MLDALADLVLGEFPQLQAERHVLEDRHMRIERIILEDHRDVAVFRRQVVDDFTTDRDVAGGDLFQPRDHPQRRALAAAGRADQHDEFVVGNVEIDGADGLDIAKFLDDLVQRDFGHSVQPLVAPAVSPAM